MPADFPTTFLSNSYVGVHKSIITCYPLLSGGKITLGQLLPSYFIYILETTK